MKKARLAIAVLATAALWGFNPWDTHALSGEILPAEPNTNVLGECDFDPGDPIVKVPVAAGAEAFRCGLATFQVHMFNKPFADKFDRFPPERVNAEKPGDLFLLRVAPATSIGGAKIEFPNGIVYCSHFNPPVTRWSRSDGMIGLDVLVQHIVQVDFDEGKLRFLRAVPKAAGERFDIVSLQQRPRLCALTVKAQCCDEPAEEFFVQLENPDAIQLRSRVYRKLVKKGSIRRFHRESTLGLILESECWAGTADSFTIGRFQTKDVRAVVGGDNLIGLGYLSRFVVTFDFPRGFMYLQPGNQIDREDAHDVSGLGMVLKNDSPVIRRIEPGSTAEAAGFKTRDVIVDVDGQTINRENLASLWRKLRHEGSTLHIRVKRGGDEITFDLKLEETPEERGAADKPPGPIVPNYLPHRGPLKLPELIASGEPKNA